MPRPNDIFSARQKAIAELLALGQGRFDEGRPIPAVLELSPRGPGVTDQTMELLGDLTELRVLSLHDTRVTDAGMKRIGQLAELQESVHRWCPGHG